MFQRILHKCNYHKVEIADDESFKQLSTLSQVMLYTTTNIGFFLAQKKDTRGKIISLFDSIEPAIVAYSILYGNQQVLQKWLQSLPPEALGPLLKALLSTPKACKIQTSEVTTTLYNRNEALALQQLALCFILKWLSLNAQKNRDKVRTFLTSNAQPSNNHQLNEQYISERTSWLNNLEYVTMRKYNEVQNNEKLLDIKIKEHLNEISKRVRNSRYL